MPDCLLQAAHELAFGSSHSRRWASAEGIPNRDRKTATYKLALFRALSEIATTEFEQAIHPDHCSGLAAAQLMATTRAACPAVVGSGCMRHQAWIDGRP